MIVDVHAHYTQASAKLDAYRGRQVGSQNKPVKGSLGISDDEIVASLQGNIRQMRDRGIDRLMFSPRASGMGHDFGNELISRYWTEANNDLIGRVCKLFPEQFSPVGQLPQIAGGGAEELPGGDGPLREGDGVRRVQHKSRRVRRGGAVHAFDWGRSGGIRCGRRCCNWTCRE